MAAAWGSRSVDMFEKVEQVGEGTYGYAAAAALRHGNFPRAPSVPGVGGTACVAAISCSRHPRADRLADKFTRRGTRRRGRWWLSNE